MKKELPSLPELLERTRRTLPAEASRADPALGSSLSDRILEQRRKPTRSPLPIIERWSLAGAACAVILAAANHFLTPAQSEPSVSELWMDLTEEKS